MKQFLLMMEVKQLLLPKKKIQMLKELAELKAQGILTEEEFAAQKKSILG